MSKVKGPGARSSSPKTSERGAEEKSEEIMGTNSPKLTRDNKLDIQEGQRTQSQVNMKHCQHPVGSKFPPASAQSRAMNSTDREARHAGEEIWHSPCDRGKHEFQGRVRTPRKHG